MDGRRGVDNRRRRQAVHPRSVEPFRNRADRRLHRRRRADAADGIFRSAAAESGQRYRAGAFNVRVIAAMRLSVIVAIAALQSPTAFGETPPEYAATMQLTTQ